MANFDILEIKKLPVIFKASGKDYGYIYYHHPKEGIYLEYNIYCDAKILINYRIEKEGPFFMLTIMFSMNCNAPKENNFFAGNTESEAIEFMIEKIIDEPASNPYFEVDVQKLKEELRKIFSK